MATERIESKGKREYCIKMQETEKMRAERECSSKIISSLRG